jgi:hypothetical protein
MMDTCSKVVNRDCEIQITVQFRFVNDVPTLNMCYITRSDVTYRTMPFLEEDKCVSPPPPRGCALVSDKILSEVDNFA